MVKRQHKGFTLIELVIVVAIIGILALIIIPQFNNVTEDSKLNVFTRNCKTVVSSIGVFQASHDGEMPEDSVELGTTMNGGWSSILDKPKGADYDYAGGIFTATYTDKNGTVHTFKYPN